MPLTPFLRLACYKRGMATLTWTREKGELIVKALGAGTSRKAAAAIAGVTFQTFKNWLARAEDEGGEMEEWATAVIAAEGDVETRMSRVVVDAAAAEGEWKAAAWWLERRSEAFKPKSKIEAEVTDVSPDVSRARELMRAKFGDVGES